MVKNPPANAGDERDEGSIPGSGRSPGEGHGMPVRYSRLKNTMDRGAFWATVSGFFPPESVSRLVMSESVHGILQARILEGVVMLFSRGSSQPED